MLVSLIKCAFGPELYRVYRQNEQAGRNYVMNNFEYIGNTFINMFKGLWRLGKCASPVILAFLYSRNYFTLEGAESLGNMVFIVVAIMATHYTLRGFGRAKNTDYQLFIEKYKQVNRQNVDVQEKQKFLSEFDFNLSGWMPDYVCSVKPNPHYNEKHRVVHESIIKTVKMNVWRVLSYICVDTFGLRMAYPGTILSSLIGKVLMEGRSNLIEKKKAKRAVIKTACSYGNHIDTLFVDQRSNTSSGSSTRSSERFATISSLDDSSDSTNGNQFDANNGKTLVICCDGNASFYEVGCFSIPIEKGYSTLGWNYPGFGESAGLPYPAQLTAAADAVMQYAFSLGFKAENIVLFSWSIGGFACSWLSNQYPDIKAVVLDACFDSIVPLAQQQMPKFASTFVEYAIRHTLNLNVAQLISNFNGPVLFIRRTQDEIISTVARHPSTNRGNNLLLKTLNTRYPYIFDGDTIPYIRTWLSAKTDSDRGRILKSYSSDVEACEDRLHDYIEANSGAYPINIGGKEAPMSNDEKLTLAFHLADKYLLNFESSHCTPLPLSFFVEPWTEKEIKRFSF